MMRETELRYTGKKEAARRLSLLSPSPVTRSMLFHRALHSRLPLRPRSRALVRDCIVARCVSLQLGLEDVLREHDDVSYALVRVHGEDLILLGRERASPLLECRRAFPYVRKAIALGVVVNGCVVLESLRMHPLRSV